jgi:NADH-quinone oxidoreductase subunit J
VEILLYASLALVIVVSALIMLFSRNTVYSALFLVLNFSAVAVLYLLLGAPFVAMTQISVYAGAIMVLFLFVIMLLGRERMSAEEHLRGQRLAAVVLGGVVLIAVSVLFFVRWTDTAPLVTPGAEFSSPQEMARQLFTNYALPFEITSAILLVAMIGAILLTRREKRER